MCVLQYNSIDRFFLVEDRALKDASDALESAGTRLWHVASLYGIECLHTVLT